MLVTIAFIWQSVERSRSFGYAFKATCQNPAMYEPFPRAYSRDRRHPRPVARTFASILWTICEKHRRAVAIARQNLISHADDTPENGNASQVDIVFQRSSGFE